MKLKMKMNEIVKVKTPENPESPDRKPQIQKEKWKNIPFIPILQVTQHFGQPVQ